MRFQFSDAARARRLAKLLKSALSGHGIEWPLNACRQALAEACGYRNFDEIEQSAGRAGIVASAVDEASPADVVALRAVRHRSVLVAKGLAPAVADAVMAAVPFTSAFGPGQARPAAPCAPTERQVRIGARSYTSGMRASNFYSSTLLDAAGRFVGLSLGTDMSMEHDNCPDGLLEALGVRDGAATVGEARIPAVDPRLMQFAEGGGDVPTALHINTEADHHHVRGDYGRAVFTGNDRSAPWRYEGRPGWVPSMLMAWSFDRISLLAYEPAARERLRTLHAALAGGSACFAHSQYTGPIIVLADAVPEDTATDALVRDVWEARGAISGYVPKGAGEATLAISGPGNSPGPR